MMNDAHELYSENRILDLVEKYNAKSASEIQKLIINDLMQFKGTHLQHDDLTVVVVKIKTQS